MATINTINSNPIGQTYIDIGNNILKGNLNYSNTELNSMTVGLGNGENFIVFKILINPIEPPEDIETIRKFKIDYRVKNSLVWKNLFSWASPSFFNIFTFNEVLKTKPLLCSELRFTKSSTLEGDLFDFPVIADIEYIDDLTNIPITSPANLEIFNDQTSFVVGVRPQFMYSMVLKETPCKILNVVRIDENQEYSSLNYQGEISRHSFYLPPERSLNIVDSYFYDPIDNAVIIAKNTPSGVQIMDNFQCAVEYITGIGSKVDVAVEAEIAGPVYDIDKEAVNLIHPDDLDKLSQDNIISWNVLNSKEFEGGYQYFESQYKDTVAEEILERSPDLKDPRLDPAYAGRGTNWIKVGSMPDSFSANENDYKKYWIQTKDDGTEQIIKNAWITKSRGYVTFFGPPNEIINKGIRVIAPARINYKDSFTNQDLMPNDINTLNNYLPNGGIKPAALSIELMMQGDNNHPLTGSSRKMTVFRPHIMVYLRERTTYKGATYWKDIGDSFGTASETTGKPYWI